MATQTKTAKTRMYEGMFLLNPAAINSSVGKATEIIAEILKRAHAEVVSMSKWDDRKLAYKIEGQKRGLFILAHFNADPSQVAHIERDVNLSETVLRCLIIRGEHLGETEMQIFTDAQNVTRDAIALEASNPQPAAASDDDDSDASDSDVDTDTESEEEAE
ncbi:MAG: 30S ribosomal protein S6 [Planctomycetes bacterium]|nr:30S ribosomal protein S6 [Planctomycetota bacterium]